MDMIENSLLCGMSRNLWFTLCLWYEGSGLARLLRGMGGALTRCYHGSYLGHFLGREGAISRSFKHSVVCNLLTVLFNLPGMLLHLLYTRFRRVFEGSIFARIGFSAVENTPIAVSWLMLLILVIPYDYWNNAYSFLGFGLLLAFAMAASMRKPRQRLDIVSIGPYGVMFAGFVILAVPLSAYAGLSKRFLLYHIACMLCVLVIVSTVERREQLMRIAAMATGGLVLISAYGVVQRIQGVEVNPSYVDLSLNEGMPGRVFSMFENPNAFGEVLVLPILVRH